MHFRSGGRSHQKTRVKKRVSGGATLPLTEWIREFYLDHLKEGWKMEDIENIDMNWYTDLTQYQEEKESRLEAEALDRAGL